MQYSSIRNTTKNLDLSIHSMNFILSTSFNLRKQSERHSGSITYSMKLPLMISSLIETGYFWSSLDLNILPKKL